MADETVPPTVTDTAADTTPETVADTVQDDPAMEGLDILDDPTALLPNASGEAETDDSGEDDVTETPADDSADEGNGDVDAADEPAEIDEPATDAVVDEPATEQPTETTQPKPDAAARQQAAQAKHQRETRMAAINKEIAEIKKVPVGDRDPYDHTARLTELLSEKDELRDAEMGEYRQAHEEAAARQQVDAVWKQFGQQFPLIGEKDGRAAWESIETAVAKEYPGADPATQNAIANDRFRTRVNVLDGQRKAAAAKKAPAKTTPTGKAKPPVKPAARILPAGAVGTSRPGKGPRTAEEEFDAKYAGRIDELLP